MTQSNITPTATSTQSGTCGMAYSEASSGAKLPHYPDARQLYIAMQKATTNGPLVNFLATVTLGEPKAYTVPTPLFPLHVLEAYTAKNLGLKLTPAQQSCMSAQRGGTQGDYSLGMPEKIKAVIRCLQSRPNSKRAYIIVPNNPAPEPTCDEDAKCLQLINFTLIKHHLHAAVTLRAQAIEIFPKNIHFIGQLLQNITRSLGPEFKTGPLLYHAIRLAPSRLD